MVSPFRLTRPVGKHGTRPVMTLEDFIGLVGCQQRTGS